MQDPYKDRLAVVTGGTRGIGRAIVKSLAGRGCHIAFNYHSQADKARELQEEMTALGVKVRGYRADVTDMQAVGQMASAIKKEIGNVDYLINNAGVTRDVTLLMMKETDWHNVINTNLNGLFNSTKAFIMGMMKARQGRIVNISSITGLIGQRGQTNYAASKAGIIGFTKSLAREIAPLGMTANVVAPGFIETEMVATWGEKRQKEWLARIPLGRFGSDREIGETVAFLLSDAAAYITGQVITVDGGLAI